MGVVFLFLKALVFNTGINPRPEAEGGEFANPYQGLVSKAVGQDGWHASRTGVFPSSMWTRESGHFDINSYTVAHQSSSPYQTA